MEQPPDSRGTEAFPSANQKKPDQIPAAPGPVADEPTGRPIPPFTGKIPLPQRPPNSSGPISKPGKRSAAPGEIPLPQLPLSGDKGLSAPQSPQAGTGKIPIFALTGKMPAAQAARAATDGPAARSDPAQTTGRMPIIIPPDKKMAGSRAQAARTAQSPLQTRGLNKRLSWYIVSIAGILTIILGFVFAVPLNTGQQTPTTVAQGIANLIQTGNFAPQPQGQTQGPGQSPSAATTGFPGPGSGNTQLFKKSSPWNVPIGANVQLDPNSQAWASELRGCCHVPAMFGYGMPIYISTTRDPLYTVEDTGDDALFLANQPIHIPNDAAPSPGSDKWLFIYDTTRNLIFEMWNTSKDGNTWTTQTGNVYSPTGDGVLQIDGSPQGGNGASYFGGVVTDADIQRGYINHALSLASQFTGPSSRYPMHTSDGHDGDIPMGARIQLDPAVNCNTLPGASRGEKMVCQALETYGGYLRDTGGVTLSMYFEGEDLKDPSRNPPNGSPGNAGRAGGVFGNAGLHDGEDLTAIPWNRLRVLKSWNSFTALGASSTPAPLLSRQTPALRSALAAPALLSPLALLATRPVLPRDPARIHHWRLTIPRALTASVSTTAELPPPPRDRLLSLRLLQC